MKIQSNQSDFGRSIVIAASNGANKDQLQDLLKDFGIADKSKFVVSVVECLLYKYEAQVVNYGGGTAMVTIAKGVPSELYREVRLTVSGLSIMNSTNPDLAKNFIDKTCESKEELALVMNYFYKSAEKHEKDKESSYQQYVSQQNKYEESCKQL